MDARVFSAEERDRLRRSCEISRNELIRYLTLTVELQRDLLAVLISQATDFGLVRMADVSGVPFDVLV